MIVYTEKYCTRTTISLWVHFRTVIFFFCLEGVPWSDGDIWSHSLHLELTACDCAYQGCVCLPGTNIQVSKGEEVV